MTSTDAPLTTDTDLFRRWSALIGGAGMRMKDLGSGIIEMQPDVEFVDLMTDEDRRWVLQVPDDPKVTWAIGLESEGDEVAVNAPCLLAPTMQSRGWFELLTKRDLRLPVTPHARVDVWAHAAWTTTRGEKRLQTIARGYFTVPPTFHTMGAPCYNVFMPGRMLLSVHIAVVDGTQRAVAASLRAKLDEDPFDEQQFITGIV
jgi:hypothetical protein